METWIKRSLPVEIKKPFDRIEIVEFGRGFIADFCFGGDLGEKIRVKFPAVAVFRWSDDCFDSISEATPRDVPEIGSGSRGAYPFLEVTISRWIGSLDDGQKAAFTGVKHFKLFSRRDTFDVLAITPPTLELVHGLAKTCV